MPATVLTGEPTTGINTYFALGSSATPSTVQDISDFLTGVDASEDTDEQEATTFRRQSKRILAGFSNIGYTLNGYYSEEAYEFFAPLRKMENVAFEYGPGGNEVGQTLISGLCTVFAFADHYGGVEDHRSHRGHLPGGRRRGSHRREGGHPGAPHEGRLIIS
jgi:hypothetical protein